ncbi:dioxygenase family protein [Paenibacillus sp. MMS18-CY102]|uniref:dioxygenase family protein n=1 Tax=Paenibacillus sp. MMS18-CY102 TaxID=2682849 RepID=UPI0013656FED|nr:class III extradiol ring-cleavage dioxygenase [Paenibacillus sp. MMS18-CY102]MWC27092.1 dioxygenase [Paenibacillus sp. MMS18-CY102]
MMPALFIGHGSPMMAIEDNECGLFLSSYGATIGRPKAIVIFTAHWETDVLTISSTEGPYDTIYDFGGFPRELFEKTYPAPGSPSLAEDVGRRLSEHGIPVQYDQKRGLDHGSWVVLSRLFPDADIPVVQVSVQPFQTAEYQYRVGEALRGIGEEDVLLIGSGATVHNFQQLRWGGGEPEQWAIDFDDWLVDHMAKRDLEALFHYDTQAPNGRLAVPRPEHFVPMYIAYGSGDPDRQPEIIHRSYEMGSLSYMCMKF